MTTVLRHSASAAMAGPRRRGIKGAIMAALIACFGLAAAGASTPPMPRLKPPPKPSQLQETAAAATVRRAFDAAAAGQWSIARSELGRADGAARELIRWRIVTDPGSGASWSEMERGLRDLRGFPRMGDLRERVESRIDESALTPAQRAAWLEASGPVSGEGKAELARTYYASGAPLEGDRMLRDAWRNHALSAGMQQGLVSERADRLTSDDHAVRVDMLLWLDQRSQARALLSRLPADQAALAAARLRLREGGKNVQAAIDAVPAALQDHPGLLFDRAQFRRRSGQDDAACALIAEVDGARAHAAGRDRLWREKRRCSGAAMRVGDAARAYRIAASHGLTAGEGFAQAEFLAGWLALRKLRDPARAMRHFETLDRGVATPVSKARALYWRGEAARASGDAATAASFYQEASKLPTAFFGQLAATKTAGPAMLSLGEAVAITPGERAAFEERVQVRAMHLLAAIGDAKTFQLFAFALDDQLTTPADHELLAQFARARLSPEVAVRSAKAGLRRGVVAPDGAYPLVDIPQAAARDIGLEPAMVLAIMRQESEFNQAAVSPAGARGLMQLMPATARLVAQQTGRQYNLSWLIDDPDYNITLGGRYLQGLIDQWSGSYILAIASYNAGPGRAREWINLYGDPRSPGVDPIDWLESIPFEETRNYVQRVLENVQIYRHRLAGRPVPLTLDRDLRRGGWAG